MQSSFMRTLCRILIPALLSLSFQSAHAGIIATDSAAAVATVQVDRAVVFDALSRTEVSSQLQALGLDPAVARQRVNAMTDEEVHTLASDITMAPAGANVGWGAVLLIGLLIWFLVYRK
jgi:hypothetical protein